MRVSIEKSLVIKMMENSEKFSLACDQFPQLILASASGDATGDASRDAAGHYKTHYGPLLATWLSTS